MPCVVLGTPLVVVGMLVGIAAGVGIVVVSASGPAARFCLWEIASAAIGFEIGLVSG